MQSHGAQLRLSIVVPQFVCLDCYYNTWKQVCDNVKYT